MLLAWASGTGVGGPPFAILALAQSVMHRWRSILKAYRVSGDRPGYRTSRLLYLKDCSEHFHSGFHRYAATRQRNRDKELLPLQRRVPLDLRREIIWGRYCVN